MLMIVRWDGMLGFAGGVVEPEEASDPKDGASAVRAAAEKRSEGNLGKSWA